MYYSNVVLDSSRGTSRACLTFVTCIIWHEDQVQTLESQLSSQNQARPVRILSPAPGEEILGTPGRV